MPITTATIYALYSKDDDRIRYIGVIVTNKTLDYVLRRMLFHPPTARLKRWVKETGLHGIGIKILDTCPVGERFALADEYIDAFEKNDLLN